MASEAEMRLDMADLNEGDYYYGQTFAPAPLSKAKDDHNLDLTHGGYISR